MKNSFPLLVLLCVCLYSCKKTDTIRGCTDSQSLSFNPNATVSDGSCTYPTAQKRPLFIYITGFWCPVCYQNGEPIFNAVLDSNFALSAISVHVMETHTNTAYEPAVADSIGWGLLGTLPVPSFYFNSSETPSNVPLYTNSEVSNYMRANTAPAKAGVDFKSAITGQSITVDAMVKFFEPVNGDCRLSIYGIEDSVYHGQNDGTGSTPMIYHRNILRACAGDWAGDKLGTNFTANQSIRHTYTLTMPADANMAHVKVLAVIWQMGVNEDNSGVYGIKDRAIINTYLK